MSGMWHWDQKAQEALEQAKILGAQAKQLCALLIQSLFLLEVSQNSEGCSW